MDDYEVGKHVCRIWKYRKKTAPSRSVYSYLRNNRVASSIQANQRVSNRNLSIQLGVSRRSLQRIIHDDLNLFPYKVQITSHLDLPIHLEFCQKMIGIAKEDNNLIHCLFMSYKAHFDLNGNVNRPNCRIWSESNPEIIHEVNCQWATLFKDIKWDFLPRTAPKTYSFQ